VDSDGRRWMFFLTISSTGVQHFRLASNAQGVRWVSTPLRRKLRSAIPLDLVVR